MPDTDSYDPSAGNEQMAQAAQKTKDAADAQKAANAKGAQAAQNVIDARNGQTKPAASSAPPSGGLIGAIKGSFKTGGTVPETGNYKLHAGEEVLPKGRASEYRKVFKQRGQDGKHKYGN